MNRIYIVICFLFFALFSCPASAVVSDANYVPDPCTYILSFKIVRLAETHADILKWQDQLDRVKRVRIVPLSNNSPDETARCILEEELPSSFPTPRARRNYIDCLKLHIDILKHRLVRIRAGDLNEILSPFNPPLAVGDIGRMHGPDTEYKRLIVLGIVDSNNCRALFYLGNKIEIPVWLEGLPTVNLVDGALIDPPPFMRITGTRDYLTPYHDKKTVFILEKFNPP